MQHRVQVGPSIDDELRDVVLDEVEPAIGRRWAMLRTLPVTKLSIAMTS